MPYFSPGSFLFSTDQNCLCSSHPDSLNPACELIFSSLGFPQGVAYTVIKHFFHPAYTILLSHWMFIFLIQTTGESILALGRHWPFVTLPSSQVTQSPLVSQLGNASVNPHPIVLQGVARMCAWHWCVAFVLKWGLSMERLSKVYFSCLLVYPQYLGP